MEPIQIRFSKEKFFKKLEEKYMEVIKTNIRDFYEQANDIPMFDMEKLKKVMEKLKKKMEEKNTLFIDKIEKYYSDNVEVNSNSERYEYLKKESEGITENEVIDQEKFDAVVEAIKDRCKEYKEKRQTFMFNEVYGKFINDFKQAEESEEKSNVLKLKLEESKRQKKILEYEHVRNKFKKAVNTIKMLQGHRLQLLTDHNETQKPDKEESSIQGAVLFFPNQ